MSGYLVKGWRVECVHVRECRSVRWVGGIVVDEEKKSAERQLRNEGWRVVGGQWICPKCLGLGDPYRLVKPFPIIKYNARSAERDAEYLCRSVLFVLGANRYLEVYGDTNSPVGYAWVIASRPSPEKQEYVHLVAREQGAKILCGFKRNGVTFKSVDRNCKFCPKCIGLYNNGMPSTLYHLGMDGRQIKE